MLRFVVCALFLAALCLAPPAEAQTSKEFEPGIKLMDAKELKGLLDAKADLVLVNALSAMEFRDKAIPGSINLPYEHVDEGVVNLPENKRTRLVFY